MLHDSERGVQPVLAASRGSACTRTGQRWEQKIKEVIGELKKTVSPRAWHKSSYSGARGDCAEVAEGPVAGIRDTRNREAGHLSFGAGEWSALLGTLSRSE